MIELFTEKLELDISKDGAKFSAQLGVFVFFETIWGQQDIEFAAIIPDG